MIRKRSERQKSWADFEVVKFSLKKLALGLGAVAAVAAVTLLMVWGGSNPYLHKPLPYLYADTKQLVFLVEEAAGLVEELGPKAFREFAVRGSRWLDDSHYLFVYDLNGVCLFHPAIPELVGRNLLDFKDMNGKPVGRWINKIGHRPERDASGWIFYLWKAPTDLTPTWKNSYVRKAVGPQGKVTWWAAECITSKSSPYSSGNASTGPHSCSRIRGRKSPSLVSGTGPRGSFSVTPTFMSSIPRDSVWWTRLSPTWRGGI